MYCPKCGAEGGRSDEFCRECGAALAGARGGSASDEGAGGRKLRSRKPPWLIGGLVVLSLGIGAATILALSGYESVRELRAEERVELLNGVSIVVPGEMAGELTTTFFLARWLGMGSEPQGAQLSDLTRYVYVGVLTPVGAESRSSFVDDGSLPRYEFTFARDVEVDAQVVDYYDPRVSDVPRRQVFMLLRSGDEAIFIKAEAPEGEDWYAEGLSERDACDLVLSWIEIEFP